MMEVPVSSGEFIAKVDTRDYERVAQHTWRAVRATKRSKSVYAQTKINGREISLHRFVVGAKPDEIVDHWDHDGLNCQGYNLRLCSAGQNTANQMPRVNNTSGYRG